MPLISEVFYYKIINIFFNYFSYIRIQGFILGGRYPGLAGHMGANGFLLTLGMGVYLGGFLIDKEKQKIKNIVFLFFISISILLTGSRAMILINGFAFIICFYLKSKNSFIEIFKKGVLLIGIIVLFISIVYMIYPQNIINIFDRFSNGDASIYSRFVLYSFAIELFLSRILFGYGINTFLPLTYTNVNMGEKTYVHNVILQLLAETGIIGSIVILIPYLVTFIYTIKVFKKSYIDYKKNILMSLYIQIVFLLYFFTGNPIYDYNILVSYFIIISIPIYYGYKTKNYALSKILK
ncbi:O-antigen ligase family protein [Clostridium perfringens]|uniref:O-antigen ligase family protein n=1 Tax=Clostridium perfringens TaxID=1502 RepID=UPI0032DA70D1